MNAPLANVQFCMLAEELFLIKKGEMFHEL